MKKNLLIISFLLLTGFVFAQPAEDKAAILQICIDLPELQQYYQVEPGVEPQNLYVMMHDVSFEDIDTVMKFGQPVLFPDKNEVITDQIDNYFLFYIFEIIGNKARVDLKGTIENIKIQKLSGFTLS